MILDKKNKEKKKGKVEKTGKKKFEFHGEKLLGPQGPLPWSKKIIA